MPNVTRKPWHTLEEEASLPVSRADLNRARQFMPFASLKGFFSIVRDREKLVTPRRDLQEEDISSLNKALSAIRKNDMVRVRYYDVDAYHTMQGLVTRIEPHMQTITVVKTSIPFSDLESIEIIKG
ncbi:MAG: YolD-like family protein [Eggerthellaceae bacterium]|nr:YolD-like family protein [Eggerthellaceae bacterium]